MFAKTKFVIDRFHGITHKCSEYWKLASYPGFSSLVTTASESHNAFLQPFHSMCAYMKQSTFVTFMDFIIGVKNYLVNKELEHCKMTLIK